jgi:uncharacterized protein YjiS (DUF1127 family)
MVQSSCENAPDPGLKSILSIEYIKNYHWFWGFLRDILSSPKHTTTLIAMSSLATSVSTSRQPRRAESVSILATVRRWIDVSRERHALASLDDAALADLGLRREDARREASKFFWR